MALAQAIRLRAIIATVVVPLCALVHATVLHVPAEYTTIQAALDDLADTDTILVEIGEYAEALTAPALRFLLKGEAIGDTGDFQRPVIDASLHPNQIHQGCLILPQGSRPTIEGIRFRNRVGMSHRTAVGGVTCYADTAIFRRCAFDSTLRGIWSPNTLQTLIVADQCCFRGDSVTGIYAESGTVLATNCGFVGGWNYAHLGCGPRSVIEACEFSDDYRYLLLTNGSDIQIRDCIFGPSGVHGFEPVALTDFSGSVSNCVFHDLYLGPSILTIEVGSADPVVVESNMFQNNHTTSNGGTSAVVVDAVDGADRQVLFCGNTFLQCSTLLEPKSISVRCGAEIRNNRFIANEPQHRSAILCQTTDSVHFRQNVFESNGRGVNNAASVTVDARFNWWGDSTGPYHPQLNPDGLGDQVGNNILFEPWTRDTLEWLESETDLPEIPQRFDLSVYPNPFNATATIRIRVPEPEILKVELFDLLGRKVDDVWSGAVAIEKTIRLDAQEFPSGNYFVRTTEAIYNRPRATVKLALVK